MSKKSSSKPFRTGQTINVPELLAITGEDRNATMIVGLLGRHYCRRVNEIGKCYFPCRTSDICRVNIMYMMGRLRQARNEAALLTWLAREEAGKMIDEGSGKFEEDRNEFGEKVKAEFSWDDV